MTRTWFNVKGQPIFAWAGLWTDDHQYGWGPVYSGAMTDCNEAIRPIHSRMPVLLMPEEYDLWLKGSFEDTVAFQQRCFPDDLIEITRTNELWVKRKPASSEPVKLL
jgi:putative SOS response-associated peptidase YedK